MAKLTGYTLINGSSKNYPYFAEVETQTDIDNCKKPLIGKHRLVSRNKKIIDNNKLMGVKDEIYQILFYIAQPQGGGLQP